MSLLDDIMDEAALPSTFDSLDPTRKAVVAERISKLRNEARHSREDAERILLSVAHELRRRRWFSDPVAWATERMGQHIWSKQEEVLTSIKNNRRTAAVSCHEVGKSFIAADAVCWWLDVHPPGSAFVVTSAPTAPQVKAILWREIGRIHAQGKLAGRVNTTEWHITMPGGNEELVAFGRKPNDYEPTAFQGIHAPYVLFVFDEACGMAAMLWEAADSIIANDNSKALAIGNPDDPTSEFYNVCQPGSGWHVVQISAFDSPNFTGESCPKHILDQLIGRTYVEEKRRKWAANWRWADDGRSVIPPLGADIQDANPVWLSKILGIFPKQSGVGSLIPLEWIRRAQQRVLTPSGPRGLGVDVGGGGDSSTICHRHGQVARIVHEDHNPDTMHTCGVVVHQLDVTGATEAHIDMVGIGRGVADRGKELGRPFIGINVGEKADEEAEEEAQEAFANLRAQYWWQLRAMFEADNIDIDPQDDDLAAELAAIRFKRLSNGKIQIESKEDMKRRGQPSPNRADALMLAFATPRAEPGGVLSGKVVW